jgi:ATP-dependent Clp protease adapter protein ClpS
MSDQQQQQQTTASTSTTSSDSPGGSSGSAGQAATLTRHTPRTAPPARKVDHLPPWNVLLHNDEFNAIGYVVETIVELVKVNPLQALLQTLEADKSGIALLMTTHREHAELLCEQFTSKRLTVTIEPGR